MKLVLREDVKSLGFCGDVVDVKDGFGRNYLIPQGFAMELSKANLQLIEAQKENRSLLRVEEQKQAHSLLDRIEAESWAIEAKMNEEGHLFGSVHYADVVALFAERGYEIQEKDLALEEPEAHPIKEKGVYSLSVRLHEEVEAKINLFVVPGE